LSATARGVSGRYAGRRRRGADRVGGGAAHLFSRRFGGVTSEIIVALGIDDASWLPKRLDLSSADERLLKAIENL
jgi:hypothetical protein